MWEALGKWDLSLYRYINLQLTNTTLDPIMWLFSWNLAGAGIFFGALAIAALKQHRYAMRVLGVLGLTLMLSDVICYHVLKPWGYRVRPCHHQMDARRVGGICGSEFGMPSNHAANGMATVVVLANFAPRAWTLVALAVVLITGYSRVYLGVHYPGDVAAGFAFGALLGAAVSALLGGWIRKVRT